ncbi:hypothetical protein BDQ12DRAFT_705707 [Crucibulum laeve]|uniref:DUF6593 domain-containing protein n=1 Tax=Crucibulum laeve TaxID=68775 RepID=A0A5C3LYH9_9AGAR|nr:hypothetical protein BDQ12DRAFT_705707 [Crucibulum laeve]
MYSNNPYAQGGWYNPANPNAAGQPGHPQGSYPPTFGALPGSSGTATSVIEFKFNSFNIDIFNCVVRGPKDVVYFTVSSDTTYPETTTIAKPGGQVIGTVEWHQHPFVEVRGQVAKQRVSQWLTMSADSSHRTMTVHGRTYAWVPRGNGIYLYSTGPTQEQFARISRGQHSVSLEIASQAIQAGIFEATVVATLLIQCGRYID